MTLLNVPSLLYFAAKEISSVNNLALIGDSLEYSMLIREQLDSLNVLIQWDIPGLFA